MWRLMAFVTIDRIFCMRFKCSLKTLCTAGQSNWSEARDNKSLQKKKKRNSDFTVINWSKIMTIIDDDRHIKIGDPVIVRVELCVSWSQVKLGLDNQTAEVKRRIGLGWAAFGKLRLVFKKQNEHIEKYNSLKRKVFDSCVLPVLT